MVLVWMSVNGEQLKKDSPWSTCPAISILSVVRGLVRCNGSRWPWKTVEVVCLPNLKWQPCQIFPNLSYRSRSCSLLPDSFISFSSLFLFLLSFSPSSVTLIRLFASSHFSLLHLFCQRNCHQHDEHEHVHRSELDGRCLAFYNHVSVCGIMAK